MKFTSVILLWLLSFVCFASEEIEYLKALDREASNYRLRCIECVTDAKLTKKRVTELEACKTLYSYTSNGYLGLKQKIIAAEKDAKNEGESKGLESRELRDKLILIMSAKSHMSVELYDKKVSLTLAGHFGLTLGFCREKYENV